MANIPLHTACPKCNTPVTITDPQLVGRPTTCIVCGRLYIPRAQAQGIQQNAPPPMPVANIPIPSEDEYEAPPANRGTMVAAMFAAMLVLFSVVAGLGFIAWQSGWIGAAKTKEDITKGTPKKDKDPDRDGKKDDEGINPLVQPKVEPKVEPKRGMKRFALLVGLDAYSSKDLPDLKFAEKDVEDLAELLPRGGYEKEDITVLTGKRGEEDKSRLPTSQNIRDAFTKLKEKTQDDDVILVVLVGHGVESSRGRHAFCAQSASLEKGAWTNTLPITEVYDELGGAKGAMKLFVFDCCRANPRTFGLSECEDGFQTTPPLPKTPNTVAFFACGAGERSWEVAELRQGLFLHNVMEGLREKANVLRDGKIGWPALFDYADRETRSHSRHALRRVQRPVVRATARENAPSLVQWPENQRELTTAPKTNFLARMHISLDQDFLKVRPPALPDLWKGASFQTAADKEGRHCLEPRSGEGIKEIILPKVYLPGDFYLEIEYVLDGRPESMAEEAGQWLKLTLEGRAGADQVRAEVDYRGQARISPGEHKKPVRYKPFGLTRFRLEREGKDYRILLNDELIASERKEDIGIVDTIQLGLTAVTANEGEARFHKLKQPARIYSVRVGPVLARPKDSPAPIALDEGDYSVDLKRVKVGNLPAAWRGADFTLTSGLGKRPCLQARGVGTKFVTLPAFDFTGDFWLEAEAELDGKGRFTDFDEEGNQHLTIVLSTATTHFKIEGDHIGRAVLANSAPRVPARFTRDDTIRLRLEREGSTYRVLVNGGLAVGGGIKIDSTIKKIELGLTAGGKRQARLYGFKIGKLAPVKRVRDDPPEAALGGLREDFKTWSVGGVPPGWEASPVANVAIEPGKTGPGLELIRPLTKDQKGDSVKLPALRLPGRFVTTIECEVNDRGAQVLLGLSGEKSSFYAGLSGEKKLQLPTTTLDVAKWWRTDGEPQILRIERTETQYVVKLNDKEVTTVAQGDGSGAFTAGVVTLLAKDAKTQTPRVTSVRIVPLK